MAKKIFDSDGMEYILVEKGDTLSHIANKYSTTVNKLAAVNGIEDVNYIVTGQKLKETADASSSKKNANTNKAKIKLFGEQSNADNTLYATWEWNKSKTDKYQVRWDYATGDGVWFVGKHGDVTSKQDTYSIPNNATKVRFKVKPVAKGKINGDKTTYPWTAGWSETKTWTHSASKAIKEMDAPTPSAELNPDNKYQILASVTVDDDLLSEGATHIEFVIREEGSTKKVATGQGKIDSIDKTASYVFKVSTGKEYEVYCRAYKSSLKVYSKYSTTSQVVSTLPAVPSGFKIASAELKESEYNIRLTWKETKSATSYDIEYATRKDLFDVSDKVTAVTGIKTTERIIFIPQDEASKYFFRVRAVNDAGESSWSSIKSVTVGTEPAAPTTWSSTTTAVAGEDVTLYWVHNSEDGSSQVKAKIAYRLGGANTDLIYEVVENTADEDEQDQTSFYTLKKVPSGTITYRIATMGVSGKYGPYSIQRRIEVSAPPTLSLTMEKKDGTDIDTLEAFPFYVKATAGPSPQKPIGYHLSVLSNESYETVDRLGNDKTVSAGEEIYSKYFNTNQNPLNVGLSAENLDLENGMNYTIKCVVSMNSGLTAEASYPFDVDWVDTLYVPNAEITFDANTLTTSIRPYCENVEINFHKVIKTYSKYTDSGVEIGAVYGQEVRNAKTDTGLQVYSGSTADGEDVYYCMVETQTRITTAKLSVYRREFDGAFTELATGLDSAKSTTITDPHPALDYARYRLVASDKETGAVSYYDPPGLPINCSAIIIQWDEQWSAFDTEEDAELEQPPWTGSLLKLPYNVDVNENVTPDVSTVAYIGRANPVSYYGTQIGQTASWSVVVEKDDVDTIYALRRLARWMGDVYVREPSGVGYWANIVVSFSQKHSDLTIPVSLEITRVEGGV